MNLRQNSGITVNFLKSDNGTDVTKKNAGGEYWNILAPFTLKWFSKKKKKANVAKC